MVLFKMNLKRCDSNTSSILKTMRTFECKINKEPVSAC